MLTGVLSPVKYLLIDTTSEVGDVVATAMLKNVQVFWDMRPCELVNSFGEVCCPHLQVMSSTRKKTVTIYQPKRHHISEYLNFKLFDVLITSNQIYSILNIFWRKLNTLSHRYKEISHNNAGLEIYFEIGLFSFHLWLFLYLAERESEACWGSREGYAWIGLQHDCYQWWCFWQNRDNGMILFNRSSPAS